MINQLSFTGLTETLASFFLLVIQLIKDDFPTLERPINAYSGNFGSGHSESAGLLLIKLADLMEFIKKKV